MPCQGLEIMGSSINLVDYLVFPTTCFYYFYAIIFFGLFILLTLLLYNRERELLVQPDLISSIGVSATAIMFLATIATTIKSTSGIPMLQQDLFLFIIALWIVSIIVWFFKK